MTIPHIRIQKSFQKSFEVNVILYFKDVFLIHATCWLDVKTKKSKIKIKLLFAHKTNTHKKPIKIQYKKSQCQIPKEKT